MGRILLLIGVVIAVLATAAALRLRDAPYIAYEQGDVRGALDGLTHKAAAGDGFAAYLIARANQNGTADKPDPRAAAAWFMEAARAGEIRGVAGYLMLVVTRHPDDDVCSKAVSLLELAARTGALGAVAALGDIFRHGRCGKKDLVAAASYYTAATRLDHRMQVFVDVIEPELSKEERARVKSLPSAFDLDPRAVLARFVSEAPALLPDSLR